MFNKNDKVTLKNVRDSVDRDKMQHQPIARRALFQPLADLLTVPFNNMGWTANGVTVFRGFLTVATLMAIPLVNMSIQLQCIAVFLCFLVVLDYVDGNLSRLHNSGTYFGKFLDGLFDFLLPTFLLPAVGLLLTSRSGDQMFLHVGLVGALASCFLWFTRERVRSFAHYMRIELLSRDSKIRPFQSKEIENEHKYASVMQSFRNVSYSLLLLPDFGHIFFVVSVGYLVFCLPLWFYLHIKIAVVFLNNHKFSALVTKK